MKSTIGIWDYFLNNWFSKYPFKACNIGFESIVFSTISLLIQSISSGVGMNYIHGSSFHPVVYFKGCYRGQYTECG